MEKKVSDPMKEKRSDSRSRAPFTVHSEKSNHASLPLACTGRKETKFTCHIGNYFSDLYFYSKRLKMVFIRINGQYPSFPVYKFHMIT